MKTTLKPRINTSAKWNLENPILLENEIGFESDTGKFKIGNNTSNWNSLVYYGGTPDLSSTKHKRIMNRFSGQLQYSGNQTTTISQITHVANNSDVRVGFITFDCSHSHSQTILQNFNVFINGISVADKSVLIFANERHSFSILVMSVLPVNSIIEVRLTNTGGTMTIFNPTLCIDAVTISNTF